jgi:hypothetical protein
MRFWWLVPMFGLTIGNDGTLKYLGDFEFITFFGMMVEAIRRT